MSTLYDFISFKPRQAITEHLEEALANKFIPENSHLRIDIVDTGCGISEEEQRIVFEPFEQANKAVSGRYGGTGLGLYIVKKLIDIMGGTITLTSLRDIGTRFQLIIPVKEASESED